MSVNPLELIGPVLLLATVAAILVRSQRVGIRVAAALGGAAVTFLPIGPTTPAAFLLGTFGPASVATMVVVAGYLYALIMRIPFQQPRAMLVCLAVIGVVFYPLTFGLSTFDPYEFGYRGLTVPALMLACVLIGWITRSIAMPCWISLAALLYAIGAYDSNNLWDYLISPVDAAYADCVLLAMVWRNFRSNSTSTAAAPGQP